MNAIKTFIRFFSRLPLWGRLSVIGVISSLGAGGGYYIWKKEIEARQYRGASVEVEKVRKGSIERQIDAVGTLVANESVVIKPQVTGIIKEIHFKGGESFPEGAPLITIDDRIIRAQLKEAEAKLMHAQINHARKRRLFETNAGAKAKLDETQSQLGVAEAQVELAKTRLNHTIVRAPFDGVAGIKMVSIGDSVNEQKDLLAFVDVDPMKIDFKVPAYYVQLLSIGQGVKVIVDGFEGKEFEAEIEEIDARIDPQTHSLALRAKIPNKNSLLKPGLFGRVRLVAGSKEDTLLVPVSAVEVSGDEEFLYRVVKRSGHAVAERVPVTTGLSNDETIEITRGLQEEDVIIISGQVKIQDGSIVRPVGLEEEKEAIPDEAKETEEKADAKKEEGEEKDLGQSSEDKKKEEEEKKETPSEKNEVNAKEPVESSEGKVPPPSEKEATPSVEAPLENKEKGSPPDQTIVPSGEGKVSDKTVSKEKND